MVIERLEIQGFRALYDASVEPGAFTVLAGANNAGKTTLADALDFLAETHRFRLEVALSRKGGFENVAFRRMRRTRRPISLGVRVAVPLRDIPGVARRLQRRGVALKGQVVMTHRFSFKAASSRIAADFAVVDETLELGFREAAGAECHAMVGLSRHAGSVEISESRPKDVTPELAEAFSYGRAELDLLESESLDGTLLAIEALAFHPMVREFRRVLSGVRIYQISPLELRRAGVPTPNPALERYGENLPALVNYFRGRSGSEWHEIFSAMQQIVPNLVDITTDFSIDRRLVLQFKEAGVGRPWNANEVSDGTVQSLALFCALYDPRTTLAFIEEPENSVHPWIVRVFAEACRSASRDGKQIFVTTHSPALLELVQPSEVSLVWRREGRSQVAPLLELDPAADKLWDSGSVDVFELLDSGALRQAVPEGSV